MIRTYLQRRKALLAERALANHLELQQQAERVDAPDVPGKKIGQQLAHYQERYFDDV